MVDKGKSYFLAGFHCKLTIVKVNDYFAVKAIMANYVSRSAEFDA